jgi:hypothetical protein
MTNYVIKLVDGSPDGFPILWENFQQLHPGAEESEISDLGFAMCRLGRSPASTSTHTPVSDGYSLNADGLAVETFTMQLRDTPDTTVASNNTRRIRDGMLARTDWVVIKSLEAGVSVPTSTATYRQALRDITDHENFPDLDAEDWPVEA